VTAQEIIACFNLCFAESQNTILVGGASEPLYLPAKPKAVLYFREDFAASALHEAAHWCIAGADRRRKVDFGYAYKAPPRSTRAQSWFYRMELKAQSLERVFAQAAGVEFHPSADNLHARTEAFSARVERAQPATTSWLASPAGARARTFLEALRTQHGAH